MNLTYGKGQTGIDKFRSSLIMSNTLIWYIRPGAHEVGDYVRALNTMPLRSSA